MSRIKEIKAESGKCKKISENIISAVIGYSKEPQIIIGNLLDYTKHLKKYYEEDLDKQIQLKMDQAPLNEEESFDLEKLLEIKSLFSEGLLIEVVTSIMELKDEALQEMVFSGFRGVGDYTRETEQFLQRTEPDKKKKLAEKFSFIDKDGVIKIAALSEFNKKEFIEAYSKIEAKTLLPEEKLQDSILPNIDTEEEVNFSIKP